VAVVAATLRVIVATTTTRMRWLGGMQQRQHGTQTTDNNQLNVAAEELALSLSHNNDGNDNGNNDGSGGSGGG
jgi:hypothetical protein